MFDMLATPTTHILISDGIRGLVIGSDRSCHPFRGSLGWYVGFTQVLAILAEAYKCDSLSEAAKFLMILKGHKIVAMIDSKIL